MNTYEARSHKAAVAIVGLSGRFPGARNPDELWNNIAAGVRSIRTFSDEELLAAHVDPAMLENPNYVKAGPVLEGIDRFDAAFFGYSPREAEIMDPQHRLFLECGWEALETAGYAPDSYPGLAGIFAGTGPAWQAVLNFPSRKDSTQSTETLMVVMNNVPDSLASTVSYKLNLRGPSVAVQTFCSTSLVAVHMACQSLLTYECSLALAGGAVIWISHGVGYMYQEESIYSPDGHCRTFDARAQGSVMGSGVGVVVLRRLEDALADGDHIYAVILGSAVNNDGVRRVGYTAPGLKGEMSVIATALSRARADADSISYIEAHGTGTPLGDSVELDAMIQAFRHTTQKKRFCAIGSIKPNIGHLDRAAGVTGLIKTVLALNHKQLPPSIEFESPNPEIDLDDSPFYVNTRLRPWPSDGGPRRAGVSSFGLGGTNAHVVLEEAPERSPSDPPAGAQLLVLSAKTARALEAAAVNLVRHLRQHPEINLADVAYTLQVGRSAFNYRRLYVCSDVADAIASLEGGGGLSMELSGRGRAVTVEGEDAANCRQWLASMGVRLAAAGEPGVLLQSRPGTATDREAQTRALGHLWLNGVTIEWSAYWAQRRHRRVPLPPYPFEQTRYWLDPVDTALESRSDERRAEIGNWFYVPSWKRSAVRATQPVEPHKWLVLLDGGTVGERCCEWLRKRGQTVATVRPGEKYDQFDRASYSVRPSSRADYERLLEDLDHQGRLPDRVIHMWSVGDSSEEQPESEAAVARKLDLGFYSLFALTQALGEVGVDRSRITVISSGIQDVVAGDRVDPAKTVVLGPCKIIGQEYVQLRCENIDIVLPQDEAAAAMLTEQLGAELAGPESEQIIALRGPHRWVQTFEPVNLAERSLATRLRPGGVYMITGGLGGIGLAMAEHLADTVQAKLALVGRTPLPPRDEWASVMASKGTEAGIGRRIHIVQLLEARGTDLLVLQADVAYAAQMRAAVQRTMEHFGRIDGVLHMAGVPGVGIIQRKTAEEAAHVLAPKVQGTLALAEALRGIQLDFLVLFSSVSSATGGGPGQGDYCGANAFLDAWARKHHRDHGMTYAVSWGEWLWDAWQEGLQGFPEEVRARLVATRRKYGISFEEGAEVLRRVLAQDNPHLFIHTRDLTRDVEAIRRIAGSLFETIRESCHSRHYPRPEMGISLVEPRNEIEERIAGWWRDVLGVEPIGIDDNFFDLGGNSLMGIELIGKMRKELGIGKLPMTLLYDAPSVRALAEYISPRQEIGVAAMAETWRALGEKRRERLKQLRSKR